MSSMAIPDEVRGKRTSDRRVVRTRKAIREAFEKLILTHDVADISVSELAREADIDRKTFYLHYNGVESVADQMAADFLEEALSAIIQQSEGKTVAEQVDISLAVVNEIIMKNLTVFKNIANALGTGQLEKLFIRNIGTAMEANGHPVEPGEYADIAMRLQFYFSGALSLYSAWLKDDKGMPIEKVSETISEAISTSNMPTYPVAIAFGCTLDQMPID